MDHFEMKAMKADESIEKNMIQKVIENSTNSCRLHVGAFTHLMPIHVSNVHLNRTSM